MNKVKAYIPSVLVAILIIWLSLLREPRFSMPEFVVSLKFADKLVHGLMYFCWGIVMVFDMHRANTSLTGRSLLWGCMVCFAVIAVLGGAIELLQENYFPPRRGEWLDWAADLAGGGLGLLAAVGVKHIFR